MGAPEGRAASFPLTPVSSQEVPSWRSVDAGTDFVSLAP